MRFHIDITPGGYSAQFYATVDATEPCATDTGPLDQVNGICARVQAADNFLEATYTGPLDPVPAKFAPA